MDPAVATAAPREVPDAIGRPGPTPWHRLDPLTRLVAAVGTSFAVVLLGGLVCPLLLGLVTVLVPAVVAGVVRPLLRVAALLALPLAASAAVVNILFTPGGQGVLLEVGPVRVTGEGVAVALEVGVRVAVIAGAFALFYLATRPSELVAGLERRGVPARLVFVTASTAWAVPATVERARRVAEAQQARGLDTGRGPLGRVRALIPLAAPVVLGALAEAEERTLALESRCFSRPGRRTLLWAPRDRAGERVARWAVVAAVSGLAVARMAGWEPPC